MRARATDPRTLAALAVVLLAAVPAAARQAPRPGLAVVPFRDASGTPGATATVMERVNHELTRHGFAAADIERIDDVLRDGRIRSRFELSLEQARELAAAVESRYVLLGSIDAWRDDDGPEVGLTARIVDVESGATVWSAGAHVHGVHAPGLLAMRRPDDLPEATARAARRLFSDLRVRRSTGLIKPADRGSRLDGGLLAPAPIAYRSRELDRREPLRIAVLPLDNLSRSTNASVVLGDHLLAGAMALDGIEVVDPGELRRVLVANEISPTYGIDREVMTALADALGIDAVLDGTVLEFEDEFSPVPRIDMYVRLRDARTARILWCATARREGDASRVVYDVGVVHGIDRLSGRTVADLLSTLAR